MNILFHHRTRGKGAEGVHIRGVTKGLRDLGHTVNILSLPGAEPESSEHNQSQTNNQQQATPVSSLLKYFLMFYQFFVLKKQ